MDFISLADLYALIALFSPVFVFISTMQVRLRLIRLPHVEVGKLEGLLFTVISFGYLIFLDSYFMPMFLSSNSCIHLGFIQDILPRYHKLILQIISSNQVGQLQCVIDQYSYNNVMKEGLYILIILFFLPYLSARVLIWGFISHKRHASAPIWQIVGYLLSFKIFKPLWFLCEGLLLLLFLILFICFSPKNTDYIWIVFLLQSIFLVDAALMHEMGKFPVILKLIKISISAIYNLNAFIQIVIGRIAIFITGLFFDLSSDDEISLLALNSVTYHSLLDLTISERKMISGLLDNYTVLKDGSYEYQLSDAISWMRNIEKKTTIENDELIEIESYKSHTKEIRGDRVCVSGRLLSDKNVTRLPKNIILVISGSSNSNLEELTKEVIAKFDRKYMRHCYSNILVYYDERIGDNNIKQQFYQKFSEKFTVIGETNFYAYRKKDDIESILSHVYSRAQLAVFKTNIELDDKKIEGGFLTTRNHSPSLRHNAVEALSELSHKLK